MVILRSYVAWYTSFLLVLLLSIVMHECYYSVLSLTSQHESKLIHLHYASFQGWGVFAQKSFEKGDFLLEYRGEVLSEEMAQKREETHKREGKGSYMYYFKYNGKNIW